MDKFTASNGIEVAWKPNDGGRVVLQTNAAHAKTCVPFDGWVPIGDGVDSGYVGFTEESAVAVALREFFRHERDQELGRWRDPALSDRYVLVDDAGQHVVVNESTSRWTPITRELISRYPDVSKEHEVGARYFAAHPEPKPWHDAKDGQLWLIRFDDYPEADVSSLVKDGRFVYNDHCHEGTAELFDMTIVTGRRIWPEGE